jgi:shikimate dehydrogenase
LPDAPLRRVVQIGAGGAGSATAYAALHLGAGEVVIVDLDVSRAHALAARLSTRFPGRVRVTSDVAMALTSADGLIHATPTGMKVHPGLPLDARLLRQDLWVAEIVYFPIETELLRAARVAGCRVLDGSGMAVYQAVEAFRLFSGLEADVVRMRATFEAFGRSV